MIKDAIWEVLNKTLEIFNNKIWLLISMFDEYVRIKKYILMLNNSDSEIPFS